MANKLKLVSDVRLVVTLTVSARSSWSTDTTCAQVHDQAVRETMAHVSRVLAGAGLRHSFSDEQAKVTTFMKEE